MSLSSDQATEAAVFLTLYKQAIHTLQESAIRDADNEAIETFTDNIIKNSNNREFLKLCDPKVAVNAVNTTSRNSQLVKDVRAFQFSHYIFSKYMPQFLVFQGNSKQMIQYLTEKTLALQRDLLK